MSGNPNPAALIGGLATTGNVSKGDFLAFFKARQACIMADADEVRATDLSGQLMIKLLSNGRDYELDAEDATTADNGTTFLRDANGLGFALLEIDGLDGTDGATIVWQATTPATTYPPGSLWIDSDSANIDVYILTTEPLEWTDTGRDLRGTDGADGTDPGILLTWSDENSEADPGAGKIAADNDDLSLAEELYVSKTNRAGQDIEARLLGLGSSTNPTTKAAITLTKSGGSAQAFFDLTAVDDDTDFVVLHVQNHSGATGFTLADAISLQVERDGNAGAGLANVVEDTTPQLGGMLDVNGHALGDGTRELLGFEETASAVNEITVKNAATGGAPEVKATGDDTDIDLLLTPKGSGLAKVGTDPVLVGGLHLIGCWAAGDLLLSTTDGADAAAQAETSSNKLNYEYVNFPNAATKYAELSFPAPKCLNEGGTLTVEIEWTEASGATAHVCRWQAEAQAQGDGDTIDSAWGTAVADDDTGSSGTRRKVQLSGITPAGTWAVNDTIHVRVARLGGHTNDTLDVGARLLRVSVYASVNKKNDA